MINLLEFDESASDKSAINYCNTYNKTPYLIMNCSELDQQHCRLQFRPSAEANPVCLIFHILLHMKGIFCWDATRVIN